jgi:hypothetical protein
MKEDFKEPAISQTVSEPDPLSAETRRSSIARYNYVDSLNRMNQATFYATLVSLKRFRNEQPLVYRLERALVTPRNFVSVLSMKLPALEVDDIRALASPVIQPEAA